MAKKNQNIIGKFARIQHKSLAFYVQILECKTVYGKVRWLVAPLTGTGKTWVEDLRVLPNKIANRETKLF